MKTIKAKKKTNESNKSRIIGLKEFRNNMEKCSHLVQKGQTIAVFRRGKPLFKVEYLSKDELLVT